MRPKRPALIADDLPLPIYLDHNATTPVCDAAWAAMLECRDRDVWGNPSSSHAYGLHAKHFLDSARATIAESVGAQSPAQIIFTSGGTEANNIAILGTVIATIRDPATAHRNIIVTSVFEHDAVSHVVAELVAHHGCRSMCLPMDGHKGVIDFTAAEMVLRENFDWIAIVTVMHANNEIGSIQPIARIGELLLRLAAERNVPKPVFHCDAAQSIGKIPVDVSDLHVDYLSICSHKFYGPKGIGALFRRDRSLPLEVTSYGAGQEDGQRPGTENLILARGMAAALNEAVTTLNSNVVAFREARDRLLATLQSCGAVHGIDVQINGDLSLSLPNTLSVALYHRPSALYASAGRLIHSLGARIAFSAGAACHTVNGDEVVNISATLRSVGVQEARAKATLRLTTGHLSRVGDMERAAKLLIRAAATQMPDAA